MTPEEIKKMYSEWAKEKRSLATTSAVIAIWQNIRDVKPETISELEDLIRSTALDEWGCETVVEFSCEDFKVIVKNPTRGLTKTFKVA